MKLDEKGLEIRKAVLGDEYVDRSISNVSEFMVPFQEMVTEYCWGRVWSREGLERKTRSLLNLAMLTALNRPNELKIHVQGALNNGCTAKEIQEALLQATVYCGIPAGLDAFKVANGVLESVAHTGAPQT